MPILARMAVAEAASAETNANIHHVIGRTYQGQSGSATPDWYVGTVVRACHVGIDKEDDFDSRRRGTGEIPVTLSPMVGLILSPRAWPGRRGQVAPLVAVVLLCVLGSGARADENALRYDWRVDGAVTAAAFVFWGGTQLFESKLAATDCRWCDPGSIDASVQGALRWNDTSAANLASNIGAYGLVPLTSLGLLALDTRREGRLGELPGDGLVIAESVALNGALTQIVKFAVGRERPFVHALPVNQKGLTAHPADNNVSFYSSHTSFAFAMAVSTGTVASMRRYRWAPVIWVAGLLGAAAVGYLRIAADQHYLTDVLVGAAAGSTIGFAVPFGLHLHAGAFAVGPIPGGGAMLTVTVHL
jgi:membrane-associated phospholipid phosphatase